MGKPAVVKHILLKGIEEQIKKVGIKLDLNSENM